VPLFCWALGDEVIEDEYQRAYEAILLGEQADVWFKSTMGLYVVRKSQEAQKRVLEELVKADAEDSKRIRALQEELKVSQLAVVWLGRTIAEGRQYEQALNAEEGERESNG
jgi:hypothetical protein